MPDPAAIQREYYRRTAAQYDEMHVHSDGEHNFALSFMVSMIRYLGCGSVLDIGSGT
jgi:ubiquinone/menaquinone biosynthesis C-methylase UbiE